MINWVVIFFALALVTGILSYGGLAASAAHFAKILFFVCLGATVVSAIVRIIRGERIL